ncbi:MAG: hypothetical protein KGO51_14640 [Alphaproteobacteria bacterium]|nr:hypothetical protein [Alphaproteobacteria bacterium]
MASMTQERFEAYAEAFGGDVSRWPAEAREAAALLMAEQPAMTNGALARAGRLDAALDAWRTAPAGATLIGRILDTAPRSRRGWRLWLSPAVLGAGLAAACAAGVIVGVQLSDRASDASEVAVANTLSAVSSPSLDLGEGA